MTGSDWGWWRDRRPAAARLHLDTAAAGRSSRAILATAAAHSEREAACPAGRDRALLRISPHVDCTPDDLTRLRAARRTLS